MSECASDCIDTVDPRVQIELERLNTSTDDINKLEVDLDEARLIFRQLLFESTFKIQSLAKKLGGCIDKSRPYYEARFKANKALQEMRTAAVLYEKANSAHSAAREMVYLAEQGLCKLCEQDGGAAGVPLDPAWQEMLNHATARVNQAEAERGSAGGRHRITAEQHRIALANARSLQQSLKRHITKSRPYFEEKARYNSLLDAQKNKVQILEKEVSNAKLTYAQALRNLEKISDEIHRFRSKYLAQNKAKEAAAAAAASQEDDKQNGKTTADVPTTNGQLSKETKETLAMPKITNGVKEKTPVQSTVTSPVGPNQNDQVSKTETIREWIKQNGAASPVNDFVTEENPVDCTKLVPADKSSAVIRPRSLPQDFSDKYSDPLTPFQPKQPPLNQQQNKGSGSTPSTIGKNGPESENWIEINLEYSSPEEISFEKCSNFSSLECYRQIPYERMANDAEAPSANCEQSPNDKSPMKAVDFDKCVEFDKVPNSKVSADSPRRIIRNRLVAQKSLPANSLFYQNTDIQQNADTMNESDKGIVVATSKSKLKPDLTTWISRSSAKEDEMQFSPSRRQSLDVLLNDTGEKMKEIFNQGFMMFQISSLTERRNSEPRTPQTEKLSPNQKGPESELPTGKVPLSRAVRKMPSPLDKTLSYLNVCNESSIASGNSDDQGSDTDSLASVEMLSDDQIHSLMLDGHLEAVCQQMLGVANNGKTEETVP